MEKDKSSKIIFTAKMARRLLHMGNHMIDIKPDRNTENGTLFVFEITDKFKEDMQTVIKEFAKEKEEKVNE